MAANAVDDEPNDDELIAEYISVDPNREGIEDARVTRFGVPVWALIGYLPAGSVSDDDWGAVAGAYQLPIDAVHAAFAFYNRHKHAIDARIAANAFSDV